MWTEGVIQTVTLSIQWIASLTISRVLKVTPHHIDLSNTDTSLCPLGARIKEIRLYCIKENYWKKHLADPRKKIINANYNACFRTPVTVK